MLESIAEEKMDRIQNDLWSPEEVISLFELPFNDLIFKAQQIHREHFDPNAVQLSTLLSIKSGGCSEDCAYCPQSAHYDTQVGNESMLPLATVVEKAKEAKANGATRFCMGAAWRSPSQKNLDQVKAMIEAVKDLGMESCVTLGMLNEDQANQLADAGLDYYNHNLDTAPDFYGEIITTRVFQDRLDTLAHVRQTGVKLCCGGIVGLGESLKHRAEMICELANMEIAPESVPINMLVPVEGTPLAHQEKVDIFDFIRTIAVARICMPKSYVRLSAGRSDMDETAQSLAFLAGANSIFYGEKLLTTDNPEADADQVLLKKLGMHSS